MYNSLAGIASKFEMCLRAKSTGHIMLGSPLIKNGSQDWGCCERVLALLHIVSWPALLGAGGGGRGASHDQTLAPG
jgi:hypothetical protein